MKKIIKAFGAIFLLDILTNLLFVLLLGIKINKEIVIFSALFSIIVTLILDKMEILQK